MRINAYREKITILKLYDIENPRKDEEKIRNAKYNVELQEREPEAAALQVRGELHPGV